ncbi:hypothetical protein ACWF0M_19510, partial [Kribbella sp. NPDC055110]
RHGVGVARERELARREGWSGAGVGVARELARHGVGAARDLAGVLVRSWRGCGCRRGRGSWRGTG